MRKIFAPILLLVCLLSCEEKITLPCFTDDGATHSAWLSHEIKVLKRTSRSAEIYLLKSDWGNVVEILPCTNCSDAMATYYDCKGNSLCQSGGFAGISNCPAGFFQGAERTLLWKAN